MKKKSKKWIIITSVIIILIIIGYFFRWDFYFYFTSKGINKKGGDITIINARIWTGDSVDKWKTSMAIKDGIIISMDDNSPSGKVIDAKGKLIVPGMWDAHTHPHSPYILTSPEAPTLFGAKTLDEVLNRVKNYIKEHPEDKFPRFFGWFSHIFKDGQKPTRQILDSIVSDRPVYLVKHNGHAHWCNTKALEIAGALEKDPPEFRGEGKIERDSVTGLATGYLEETEYGATHGLMLNVFKRVKPYTFEEQVIIQQLILEEYPKLGVTSIWAKDGDIDITRVYEKILRNNSLPVRANLDNLFTYYSELSDLKKFYDRGVEVKNSDLPKDFLRTNIVKLYIDLPIEGWMWMFEPYSDGSGDAGKPSYNMDYFRKQVEISDSLGLQINVSIYGDRALNECMNIMEEIIMKNPDKERRHTFEHSEFIIKSDLPRFKKLGIIASMNPIVSYPDKTFQEHMLNKFGIERLDEVFNPYKDLLDNGAIVVSGSDFPLAPMDPLIGIHILVNGTDFEGYKGLWRLKLLSVEEALKTYTVYPAYASWMENKIGKLKPGFYGDFVMLSDDILSDNFPKEKLYKVKAILTVLNGHIVHEDFSNTEKIIDFNK